MGNIGMGNIGMGKMQEFTVTQFHVLYSKCYSKFIDCKKKSLEKTHKFESDSQIHFHLPTNHILTYKTPITVFIKNR